MAIKALKIPAVVVKTIGTVMMMIIVIIVITVLSPKSEHAYLRSCQTFEANSSPHNKHGRQVVAISGTFAFSISRSTYIKHTAREI